jgi:AcrR family transcriptional regulator
MSRREASKRETRRLILSAARRLFARKEVENCTLRDIAREAGVSPASVVVHFKNKTGLLEEALNADIEKTLADLTGSLPEGRGLRGSWLHLAGGFFQYYDNNRPLYRSLIRRTIFEPSTETPHMARLSESYLQFLATMIEAEKSRGRIRQEIETWVAAGALFSLYLGVLVIFFRQPEMTAETAAGILSAMTAQYLKGVEVSHANTVDPASEAGKSPRR